MDALMLCPSDLVLDKRYKCLTKFFTFGPRFFLDKLFVHHGLMFGYAQYRGAMLHMYMGQTDYRDVMITWGNQLGPSIMRTRT